MFDQDFFVGMMSKQPTPCSFVAAFFQSCHDGRPQQRDALLLRARIFPQYRQGFLPRALLIHFEKMSKPSHCPGHAPAGSFRALGTLHPPISAFSPQDPRRPLHAEHPISRKYFILIISWSHVVILFEKTGQDRRRPRPREGGRQIDERGACGKQARDR